MIKFRGKRIDNGEWVFGYYWTDEVGKHFIRAVEKHDGIMMFDYEIIPETIGQYTGLKDKKGRRIFVGDIVGDRWANCYTPIFRNGIYMAYNVKHLNLKNQDPSTQFNTIWKDDNCEIIGNKFDNPELLEVKE